jgi:hypothetical protein
MSSPSGFSFGFASATPLTADDDTTAKIIANVRKQAATLKRLRDAETRDETERKKALQDERKWRSFIATSEERRNALDTSSALRKERIKVLEDITRQVVNDSAATTITRETVKRMDGTETTVATLK